MKLTNNDVWLIRQQINKQKADERKMRVGKKTVPVKFQSDYINTSQRPKFALTGPKAITTKEGRIVRGDLTAPNDQLFQNRERARGLKKPAEETAETYKHVLDRQYRVWGSEYGRGHGVEVHHSIKIPFPSRHLRLFFYASDFYFVEYDDKWEKELRRSKTYPSKMLAMTALKVGCAFD